VDEESRFVSDQQLISNGSQMPGFLKKYPELYRHTNRLPERKNGSTVK
jgi:hypothetical protein